MVDINMKKKSYIKCLDLPEGIHCTKKIWAMKKNRTNHWLDDWTGDHTLILPVFNKNGQYYDRITKVAWAEFDGEAWLINAEYFLYNLSIANHVELHPKIVYAMKILIQEGYADKAMKKLYELDSQKNIICHRPWQLSSERKMQLGIIKRFRAFKIKHKIDTGKELTLRKDPKPIRFWGI